MRAGLTAITVTENQIPARVFEQGRTLFRREKMIHDLPVATFFGAKHYWLLRLILIK